MSGNSKEASVQEQRIGGRALGGSKVTEVTRAG